MSAKWFCSHLSTLTPPFHHIFFQLAGIVFIPLGLEETRKQLGLWLMTGDGECSGVDEINIRWAPGGAVVFDYGRNQHKTVGVNVLHGARGFLRSAILTSLDFVAFTSQFMFASIARRSRKSGSLINNKTQLINNCRARHKRTSRAPLISNQIEMCCVGTAVNIDWHHHRQFDCEWSAVWFDRTTEGCYTRSVIGFRAIGWSMERSEGSCNQLISSEFELINFASPPAGHYIARCHATS